MKRNVKILCQSTGDDGGCDLSQFIILSSAKKKSKFVIHELCIEINDVQMRRDLQNISMSRYYNNNTWPIGTAHSK